jgi:5'-methylthioadenosine phosphorylase
MRKAIIGGTGVYEIAAERRPIEVKTPYGTVDLEAVTLEDEEILFLARHGKRHTIAPHRINYRANIMALKQMGVEFIIATAAVGSCSDRFAPGDVVVMKDFIDFTKSRPSTFHEEGGEVRHVLMDRPYCPALTAKILSHADAAGFTIKGEAVYVATEGPRFETAAEIRMYRTLGGEVVGMTSVPEVVLAHEAGICYASVGIVTNMCTGMTGAAFDSHKILRVMQTTRKKILTCCVEVLSEDLEKTCCFEKENLL